jgi:hypothetical protein
MSPDGPTSGSCLPRLIWFMVGPMVLLVLTLLITEKRGGWTGPASLAFLVVLAVTILAWWLDLRGGDARTAEGKPATAAHILRFTIAASLIGIVVWCLANLIGSR